jgi:hypothetical protein
MSDNKNLPDRYFGDSFDIEEEMSSLTDEERDEVNKITNAADRRDRMPLPADGHRSILSAFLALVFAIVSIPASFIVPLGYVLAAVSLAGVVFFRVRFGFFIKIAILALVFALCGITVSTFVVIVRALM